MSITGRTPAECPVCGAGVHPRDRYCAACGADVVANGAGSDSLLDDLMPAAGEPVGRQGRWETDELPVQREQAARPAYPDVPPAPRDEEPRRGSVVLPLVVLVAVLVVALLTWRLFFTGADDPDTVADASPGTSQSAPASPEGPTEEPSADEPSATPSEEGPEEITVASTAERCGDVGGATVSRGNEVTTCEFALEVAKALGDATDLPAEVTARSPVTKREYTMTCENTAPVTCRGGDQALVYVDRG